MGQELRQGALIGGRFRLDQLLGKGGMGQVWAATNEVTERRHALKFLNTPEASAELRRRFLREARAASRVDHPNVITVHDAFELEDGTQVMVMELLSGETLRDELERREILSPEQAADIFQPVVSAVGTAHALGIVHRDLKPENVFLVADTSAAERVQVLDFGIAKLTEHDGETITQTGQVLGTPAYMALEQCTGEGKVDHRADVWAIGVMLYEALSGGRPIEADTLGQMVAKLLRAEIPPLMKVAPGTPEPLADLVDRMLTREPEGRPADLREVAAVLAPLTNLEVPSFGASGSGHPGEQDDKSSSPRPVRVGALAHPEAATVPAGNDTTLAATATVGAEATRPAERRPRRGLLLAGGVAAALAIGALWLRGAGDEVAPAPAASTAVTSSAVSSPAFTDGLEAFLPFPHTNREAALAYAEAMRAMRDGLVADGLFKRALEHDPDLAGVHARLAMAYYLMNNLDQARDHYARARRPGGKATAIERGLLECLEPLVQRQPSDLQAHADCAKKLVEAHPRSPETHLWFAVAVGNLPHEGNFASTVTLLDKAIELEPRFAHAIGVKAAAELYLGRFDDADKSLARALELIPTSWEARKWGVWINAQRGRCQANLDAARQVIAGSPRLYDGYLLLAQALAALDKSRESVEEALAKARRIDGGDGGPERLRRPSVLGHQLRLAMLHGDFEDAENKALELARRADGVHAVEPHAWPARWLVEIYLESDRASEAAQVAERFLARRDAWESDPRAEDFAVAKDAVPTMWMALRGAGKLSDDELAERRKRWLDGWRERAALPWQTGFFWLRGYGDVVDDEPQARAALAALDDLGPIPPFRPLTLGAAGVGRAYLLAGRVDEAMPWLQAASKECAALTYPYESTHAHFALGRAREAKDDTKGACAAYQVVLRRWGKAKPSSLTASAARARVGALACGGD